MCKWCQWLSVRGSGVLSQIFFLFQMIKNRAILDKINMEMALSWKQEKVCMTGESITLLNLEVIRIFQIFTLCIKHYKNKRKIKKTNFGPPLLPIKYPHKTPPLTNLRGFRTPVPPSGSAHVFGTINDNMINHLRYPLLQRGDRPCMPSSLNGNAEIIGTYIRNFVTRRRSQTFKSSRESSYRRCYFIWQYVRNFISYVST